MNSDDQPPKSHSLWTTPDLKKALNLELPELVECDIKRVSIDSRSVEPGDIFIAIRGDNFNGNHFAIDAFKSGATICIIDDYFDGCEKYDGQVIKVTDSLNALNMLAEYARGRSSAKIIGVTGSAGKTSTKEMLKLALAAATDALVYASSGNFNNHFGLPLSLVNMPIDCEYAVFELGMNHAGEISHLSKLAKPTIAVITNVDAAHLEFFESVDSIAKAKAEIFDGMLSGGNSYAIVNYDNSYQTIFEQKAAERGVKIISFGSKHEFDYSIKNYQPIDHQKSDITAASGAAVAAVRGKKELRYQLGVTGYHQALNSLAVIAAVECLRIDGTDLALKELAKFTAVAGRGQILSIQNNITIIDDCYNANPASVKAAINNLAATARSNQKTIAILGDMKELGETSGKLHQDLKDVLVDAKISNVYCVGPLMHELYQILPPSMQGGFYQDSDGMAASIKSETMANSIVLIKGSRSMKMENILNAIKN